MAISAAISGMFLFLFTTSGDPNTQLVFSSLEAFFQNIMYGVLYAYTPEVFPAPNRGTGTGASLLSQSSYVLGLSERQTLGSKFLREKQEAARKTGTRRMLLRKVSVG